MGRLACTPDCGVSAVRTRFFSETPQELGGPSGGAAVTSGRGAPSGFPSEEPSVEACGVFQWGQSPLLLEQTGWSHLGWAGLAGAQGLIDTQAAFLVPVGGPVPWAHEVRSAAA